MFLRNTNKKNRNNTLPDTEGLPVNSSAQKNITSILAAHSLAYLSVTAFIHLVALLTIPILTKFLTPAKFGLAGIYLSVNKGVYWCLEFSQLARLSYVRNKANKELSQDIGILLAMYVVITLLILAAFTLFWHFLSGLILINRWFVIIAIINSFIMACLSVSYGLWQMSQCVAQYSLFRIAGSLLNAILLLLGLFYFSWGWKSVVWSSLLSSLVVFWPSLLDIIRRYHIMWTINKDAINRTLRSVFALTPLRLAMSLFDNAGPILVSCYVNVSESGIYLLAFQITAVIPLVHDNVIAAIIPHLVVSDESASRKSLDKTAVFYLYCIYLGALLGLGVFMIFAAPPLIHWIFPPEYYLAVPLISWLVVARCFCGINYFISQLIMYKTSRLKQLSAYSFLAAAIYVGITVLLIKRYGGIGGCLGLALGHGIWLFATMIFARKSFRRLLFTDTIKPVKPRIF